MDEPTRSPFGVILRRYRLDIGLTQSELAERAGISIDAISTLERGARRSPHRDTVRLLSDALQLTSHDRALFEVAAAQGSMVTPVPQRAANETPTGHFLGALPASGPMIARDEEMERIRSILAQVAEGAGQVVLLAGELGIGKTRLAQEAMVEAASHSFAVGAGRCYETERNTAYYAIQEATERLAVHVPLRVRADIEHRQAEIQDLMLGAAADKGLTTSAEDERRIFTAVADLFAVLSNVQPVALFLDDLHWVDSSTLRLLLHLARSKRSWRVLLLGTVREAGLGEEHPELAHALQDLARERLLERIAVRRLAVDETTALITGLMGSTSEEFAEFVHRRTRGNPRFIEQLVQSLGGRLHLLHEIGVGATGRVFAAQDNRTGDLVAAKIMVMRGGIDADVLSRFEQEGEVLASLTHSNIVDVYGTFTEEHASCIIMELLDGHSLAELLRLGPLTLPRAKHILVQMAAALEYAHAHSIAHRDIKPDNIMVLESDCVKVMDFGLARIMQPDVTVQTIATTGMRLGTPLYMSPEQIEGRRVDGRTDIYSFGAVFYHMVVGHPPFQGNDPLAIAVQHLQVAPLPPRQLNPDLPIAWQDLILKSLAKDPADRFQTAADLKTAVESLGTEPANIRAKAHGRGGMTSHALLHRRTILTIAAALIVVLGSMAILLRSRLANSRAPGVASACTPALVVGYHYAPLVDGVRSGFLRAATKLHAQHPPIYVVHPSGDYAGQLRRAAEQHPCIVVVGGLAADMLTEVSAEYPTVHFALIDAARPTLAGIGFVNRPNVENCIFQAQQSGYLAGYLAGLMEKMKVGVATHGVIGVMGGVHEPQVDVFMKGYRQGARAADPRIKILSTYLNGFNDQGAARAIALGQIDGGADILFGVAGNATLGYLGAAQERGVYAIGVDVDLRSLGHFVLTSALKRFDIGASAAILEAARGHFKGGVRNIGLAEGATGISAASPFVPAAIVAMVDAQAQKILYGRIKLHL